MRNRDFNAEQLDESKTLKDAETPPSSTPHINYRKSSIQTQQIAHYLAVSHPCLVPRPSKQSALNKSSPFLTYRCCVHLPAASFHNSAYVRSRSPAEVGARSDGQTGEGNRGIRE